MEYDKIILEMLDRIKKLEDRVSALALGAEKAGGSVAENRNIKSSRKYRRITEMLEKSGEKTVQLSFDVIENAIGGALPASARVHRAFWSNTTTHSIAHAWLSIGYKTVDVSLEEEFVIFERTSTLV